MERTNWLCEHCLAEDPPRHTLATVVDHVKPLALGGSDDDANTRNLCACHHAEVSAVQFGYKPPKRRISLDGWPVED